MVSALCLAAKSGVDVRIITPHIYDKALIHLTTRSFYRELIYGGVKIYEYSKGFMHSKIFVSDDQIATVGTTNLDFRSLYLHFECGVWMYNSKAVLQIKKDYFDTLNECTQITLEAVLNLFGYYILEDSDNSRNACFKESPIKSVIRVTDFKRSKFMFLSSQSNVYPRRQHL